MKLNISASELFDDLNGLPSNFHMSKSCVSCKEWHDHFYWNHMDQKKLQFFKIMSGDFTHSMSIPEKFSQNLEGGIDDVVDLKGPSGETWQITVGNLMDGLMFQSGWKDFVSAHDIEENDFLIFRYNNDSSFEVMIFDSSGCEKPSCFFAKKSSATALKRKRNSVEVEMVQPHTPRQNSKRRTGKSEPGPSKCSSTDDDGNVKHEPLELGDSDKEAERSNCYFSRSRELSRLTEAEREEIKGLPACQPGNPAFVTVIKNAHFQPGYHHLTIPRRFSAAHLPPGSYEIALQRPNRREMWFVKCYYSDALRRLNPRQWGDFVSNNRLREGYVCVFELMKGDRRVTMTVHVIRKVRGRLVLLN